MEMPSYLDYGKIGQMNLARARQATDQMELARQYQQNEQLKQKEEIQKATLANQFDIANNPTKLEQGRATLETSNLANRGAAVDVGIKEQTQGLLLDAKQKELIQKASDAEMADMQNQGERMRLSRDPTQQAEGARILLAHKDFQKIREEAALKAKEGALDRASREKVAAGHDAASRYGADARGRLAGERKQMLTGIDDELKNAKGNPMQIALIFNRYAEKAQSSGDMEAADTLFKQGQYYLQQGANLRSAGQVAGQGGKPDLAAAGIPVRPPAPPIPMAPGAGGTSIGGGAAPPKVIKLD